MDVNKTKAIKDAAKLIGTKEGRPEGVFSSRELAKALGTSNKTVSEKIRDLIEAGHAELAGKFPVTTIAGQTNRIPMYRIIK